jgi:hypothetical protein
MSNARKAVPTVFGPDTRFNLNPAPPLPFRVRQEDELERLKGRLVSERLETIWEPESNSQVRRAANEAAALAWATPFPLLVFPVLFDEKATAMLAQTERQEQVRRVSRELLAV